MPNETATILPSKSQNPKSVEFEAKQIHQESGPSTFRVISSNTIAILPWKSWSTSEARLRCFEILWQDPTFSWNRERKSHHDSTPEIETWNPPARIQSETDSPRTVWQAFFLPNPPLLKLPSLPFYFPSVTRSVKKNSPALSTQVPCTCDDPSFDESAVPQQADRVESETTGRTTTTGCFARGVCVRVCVCVCVCVCMCAWMRACLSRAAFLDKVWLTAADALAAPSLFTASPWTHTPHSASILIGGGRVPRDFYVSHRSTTTATHVRTHVRLPLSNFRYVHVDRGGCEREMVSRVTASAPSPSQALNLRPWLFVSRPRYRSALARYASPSATTPPCRQTSSRLRTTWHYLSDAASVR